MRLAGLAALVLRFYGAPFLDYTVRCRQADLGEMP